MSEIASIAEPVAAPATGCVTTTTAKPSPHTAAVTARVRPSWPTLRFHSAAVSSPTPVANVDG